jgi:hypothetical protein
VYVSAALFGSAKDPARNPVALVNVVTVSSLPKVSDCVAPLSVALRPAVALTTPSA